MDIQRINALYDDGTLTALFKSGMISAKIFEYREIYLWVDAQRRARGVSQEKAVLDASVKFEKSRTTIYKAIYCFA